ncbi:patatin-like phospholipase family protein [Rhodococcus sp. NPDC056960]|uniref:patatin-like phospholipase family protein n=1 Tax=Rhodococcus sp. NPDC056960 TaxID=3345982 RepID=UPI0036420D7C
MAVDARTGEPVVFDRHSGVDLVDAVTASCAGPGGPPHGIGDNRYIDGGYRSDENADLAAGYGRVLVLSPFGGRSRQPVEWGNHLATQGEALRARQQSRNDLPGQQLRAHVRRRCDESVAASAGRTSRLRPGQGPR